MAQSPDWGVRGPEVDRCVGPTGRWLDAPQGKVGVPGWPLRWGWGGDDGARPRRHGGHLGPWPDPGPRPRALHGSPVPSKPSSSPSPPLLTPKEDTPLRLTAGPRRRLLDPCQKSDFAVPSGPGSLTMWQTCVEGSPCAGCWMARRGPGPQACGRGSCPPPGSPFLCPVGRWGSHGPCACWVLWGPGGQWVWHTVGARGSEALPETRALRFRVTRCERECGGLTIAGCISPDAWSVSRGTGVCHARVRGEHRMTGLRGG